MILVDLRNSGLHLQPAFSNTGPDTESFMVRLTLHRPPTEQKPEFILDIAGAYGGDRAWKLQPGQVFSGSIDLLPALRLMGSSDDPVTPGRGIDHINGMWMFLEVKSMSSGQSVTYLWHFSSDSCLWIPEPCYTGE